MSSTICTLFEGDYHYGLGALVNSLNHHGYCGVVWAGYRGPLPSWATPLVPHAAFSEFSVSPACSIRFVPLDTPCHFTNYKATFLQHVWQILAPDHDRIFYFDPDIVIRCAWATFEQWVEFGMALCEDVNSPMHHSHFIRGQWRRLAASHGLSLPSQLDVYVNAGFIGLHRDHAGFLPLWEKTIAWVGSQNQGLYAFPLPPRPFAFFNCDQDALNLALMADQFPLSLIGREGMAFIPAGYTMAHAIGGPKPWRKRYIRSALGGSPPSAADREYWTHSGGPIRLYSPLSAFLAKTRLLAAKALGRFIRRN